MKHKINRDLFFAIVDAFEIEIKHFERRKKLSVGCAIECTNAQERETHLKAAQDYGMWALEAYNYNKQFVDDFEPDID